MANQTVTYVLWFFFGWLGLHHFYLKRDRHAFVWWATLGGVFGLGWIRDIWRIPDYVQECNDDEEFYKKKKERSHVNDISEKFVNDLVPGERIETQSTTNHTNRNANNSQYIVHRNVRSYRRQGQESDRTVESGRKEESDRIEENDEQEIRDWRRKTEARVPNCSTVRFAGELVMGYILSYLLRLAVPEEYAQLDGIKWLVFYLPPIGAAIGKYRY